MFVTRFACLFQDFWLFHWLRQCLRGLLGFPYIRLFTALCHHTHIQGTTGMFHCNIKSVPHAFPTAAVCIAGARVHLVVDVFEEYRPRTIVPPGSSCEYSNQLPSLQLISTIMQISAQQGLDEQQVSEEIQLLLATAGAGYSSHGLCAAVWPICVPNCEPPGLHMILPYMAPVASTQCILSCSLS
jgi:hypothetical protein